MKLQEILNTPVMSYEDTIRGRDYAGMRKAIVENVVCKDGTKLSVQASEGHYCQPRNNQGPWHEVEVGYPTDEPDGWEQYSDGDSIYGRVPVSVVQDFINQHGGEA